MGLHCRSLVLAPHPPSHPEIWTRRTSTWAAHWPCRCRGPEPEPEPEPAPEPAPEAGRRWNPDLSLVLFSPGSFPDAGWHFVGREMAGRFSFRNSAGGGSSHRGPNGPSFLPSILPFIPPFIPPFFSSCRFLHRLKPRIVDGTPTSSHTREIGPCLLSRLSPPPPFFFLLFFLGPGTRWACRCRSTST